VLLTIRFLNVTMFKIIPPLFLLSCCRLSFPTVGLKIHCLPVFALISPNRTFIWYLGKLCGPGSSVGIVIDYRLDGWGSNPSRDEIFRLSRPALGPTQPPVKWVPGLSGGRVRQGRAADHSLLLVPRSWKSRAITLPTLWATPGL